MNKNNDYYYENYRLATFYDDLYTYREDFNLWSKYIKPNMQVLEVACGTGRLTQILLEECDGVIIDALDYSKEMLDILKHKLPKFSIKSSNSVNVIQADMRYYDTDKRYDLIIIPSNSLNHIETNEDIKRTLMKMYSLLKDGGYLLFDILNPAFEFLLRDPNVTYDERIVAQSKTNKYFYTAETSKYDYATQINRVVYTYYYCDSNGTKVNDGKEYKMSINVRLFFPKEMDSYISDIPFKQVEKFDWYDKRPFEGKTMEQIYVLQR